MGTGARVPPGGRGDAGKGGAIVAKQKILVIDDDPYWHRLLGRIFAGYEVFSAVSCAEGVDKAAFHRPDCILLDFHLNDGDAVLVCSELRKNEAVKGIPVIVVSSDPAAEIIAYAECRARCFILKGTRSFLTLPDIVAEVLATPGELGAEGAQP